MGFEFSSFLNIDFKCSFSLKKNDNKFLGKFHYNAPKNASIINVKRPTEGEIKAFQAHFSVSKGVSKGLWHLRLMALLKLAAQKSPEVNSKSSLHYCKTVY